ncbi:MAG: hypothetical protein NC405_08950 [Odoribacter sp.]|nr:hypothetical protein [Odoribacter sp.]MCM1296580.1 hypothetical protein [Muribaculaceae bacterium]
MILHIPTGKTFSNRKEAKIYFGSAYYYKMERQKTDLIFINNSQSATYENKPTKSNHTLREV